MADKEKPESQRKRIRKHLEKYGQLKNFHAVYRMYIPRASARINELRDSGLSIETYTAEGESMCTYKLIG